MSSEPNNIMVLTRDNYEEAFLLYVDEELAPEQKAAVEAFVLLHPDLKEELDLLCSTKLPADDLSFDFKNALLADSMKLNTVDESLLLYIDDELQEAEKTAVEEKLKKDEAFALQHALLRKTKLEPEVILYPNKSELYRRTERRLIPVWLRVAAVVLLMAGGTAVWMNADHSTSTDAPVAVVTQPKTPTTPVTKPTETSSQKNVTEAAAQTNAPAVETTLPVKEESLLAANTPAIKKQPGKALDKKAKAATFSKPHIEESPVVAAHNHLPVPEKRDASLQTDLAQKINKALDKKAVTPDATSPYVVVQDATAKTTVPVHAGGIETEQPEKGGGSVKGFLRKATRFIERRTGIKTVNDDDELLVGAVALKL